MMTPIIIHSHSGGYSSSSHHRIGLIVWRIKGERGEDLRGGKEEEINFCKQSEDKLLTYCGKQNYLFLLFIFRGNDDGICVQN